MGQVEIWCLLCQMWVVTEGFQAGESDSIPYSQVRQITLERSAEDGLSQLRLVVDPGRGCLPGPPATH